MKKEEKEEEEVKPPKKKLAGAVPMFGGMNPLGLATAIAAKSKNKQEEGIL